VPDTTNVTEVVLEDDGFRRYTYHARGIDWAAMERAGHPIKPANPDLMKAAVAAVMSGKASICVTFPNTRGPADRQAPEFRRQIGESVPVKEWGFKIQELRFSGDGHKVLVVLAEPGKNSTKEVVLQDDGFRRYYGALSCPPDPDNSVAPSPGTGVERRGASIVVTLPDK
jgi:hypothetical protein